MSGKNTGRVVVTVNGIPIFHCKSFDWTVNPNRELTPGMTADGNPDGYVDGGKEYSLELEAYIPRTGDIPWEDISGAVLTATDPKGGVTLVFTGCFTTRVGNRYQEKGAAVRRISMGALRKVGLG